MAKVIVEDTNTHEKYEGEYEYVEGGFEEDGTPGFHIASGPKYIYVYFESKEEFRNFLNSLKEQIPLDKE